MTKLNINLKELIKGICTICLYFLLQFALSIPCVLLMQKGLISYNIANFIIFIVMFIVFVLIYLKTLINDFKDFKSNYKSILKTTLNYWFKGFFVMIVASFLITLLHFEENTNQAANIEMLKQTPIIEILCAVILAPFVEELVFRRGLKKATTNKHLYAIVSGLMFGLIHVTSSISSVNDLIMLVYLIPYSSVGIAFGYAYSKTNNIYGTIFIHAMHNALSIIELILIGGIL